MSPDSTAASDASTAETPGEPEAGSEQQPVRLEAAVAGQLPDAAVEPADAAAGPTDGGDAAEALEPTVPFPVSGLDLHQLASWDIDRESDCRDIAREEDADECEDELSAALPAGGRLADLLRGDRLVPVVPLAWTAAENRRGDRVVLAVYRLDRVAEWTARHEAAGDLERVEQQLERAIQRCVRELEALPESEDDEPEGFPLDVCHDRIWPVSGTYTPLRAARVSAPRRGRPTLDAEEEIGSTFYADPSSNIIESIGIEDIDGDGVAEARVVLTTASEPTSPCGQSWTTDLLVFDLETFHRQVEVRLKEGSECLQEPRVTSICAFHDEEGDGIVDLVVRWAQYLPLEGGRGCTLDDRGWPTGFLVTADYHREQGYGATVPPACRSPEAPVDCTNCPYAVQRRVLPYDPERDSWAPVDGAEVSWDPRSFPNW